MTASIAPTEPQIVATRLDAAAHRARIELHIPKELRYFQGHFPDCPMLPGIVQINWAVHFGRKYFALPAHFKYLSKIKFTRVIGPNSPATLSLEYQPTRGELSFSYCVADVPCSSGNIGFSSEAP